MDEHTREVFKESGVALHNGKDGRIHNTGMELGVLQTGMNGCMMGK